MRILAIETSCDDTCAAVVSDAFDAAPDDALDAAPDAAPDAALDGGVDAGVATVLSSVVSSQGIHAEYLGVVPELASREHLALLMPAIRQALDTAGIAPTDLDGIAVTQGPGLVGCLLVGLATAKGLALSLEIPLVGVNHIEGHLHAIRAVRPLEAPFVALVASGGHTELVHASAWGRYELLGATRDDAAGEAFDKVAKLLGLGFPGGPVIDRLAERGNPTAVAYPRAWMGLEQGGLDFSFSGLKTAVKNHVAREAPAEGSAGWDRFVEDVAASFQAALLDVLLAKIEAACRRTGTRRILLAGGVACNSGLRRGAEALAERIGGEAAYPPPRLCADNAVMIGLAGLERLRRGESDPLDLAVRTNLDEFPGWG